MSVGGGGRAFVGAHVMGVFAVGVAFRIEVACIDGFSVHVMGVVFGDGCGCVHEIGGLQYWVWLEVTCVWWVMRWV